MCCKNLPNTLLNIKKKIDRLLFLVLGWELLHTMQQKFSSHMLSKFIFGLENIVRNATWAASTISAGQSLLTNLFKMCPFGSNLENVVKYFSIIIQVFLFFSRSPSIKFSYPNANGPKYFCQRSFYWEAHSIFLQSNFCLMPELIFVGRCIYPSAHNDLQEIY